MIAASFAGIEISVIQLCRPVKDFSAFARGVVFGNPVFGEICQRGVDPGQIQEAVAAVMRQEFGDEPTAMPVQAIVFEARKTL